MDVPTSSATTFGIDPLAVILAILAIGITLWQLRRTYKVVLEILDAAAGAIHSDENNGQMFAMSLL